jgi:polysaccharide pyruvyl transferase WcaK-like protein
MFGLFGIGNFGNEATLAAALEATARALPHAEISTICPDPARTRIEHGVPGVSMIPAGRYSSLASGPRLRRALLRPILEVARLAFAVRHLRTVDLMVVPGTGVLDDYGQHPTQLPLDLARWSIAARIAGTRLVYLAVGAGPIVHPVSRRLMRIALAQAAFCSFRDEGSRRFMASIGRRTRDDEVWPDLVFALGGEAAEARSKAQPFTVALGIMDYRGWTGAGDDATRVHERYLERITALAARLRVKGYGVRLVIGDERDLAAVRVVEERLADSSIEVVRSQSFTDVTTAVVTTDVVISSRYHNLVAALLAGVPAISLSYAEKNDLLLGTFDLADYCQPIETFDIGVVLAQVEAIRAEHSALVTELRRRVEATRADLRVRLDRQLAVAPDDRETDDGRHVHDRESA